MATAVLMCKRCLQLRRQVQEITRKLGRRCLCVELAVGGLQVDYWWTLLVTGGEVRVPSQPGQSSSSHGPPRLSDLAVTIGARAIYRLSCQNFSAVKAAIRHFDTDKEHAWQLIRA